MFGILLFASEQSSFRPSDGRYIASESRSSRNIGISMCNNGSNPVQISSFAGPTTGDSRWSSDSRRSIFDSSTKDHFDLCVVGELSSSTAMLDWDRGHFRAFLVGWAVDLFFCEKSADGTPGVSLCTR